MMDLAFTVTGARPDPHALTPVILAMLRIEAGEGVAVQSIQLRCQVRVEPDRRQYDGREQELLEDLFGTPDRWSDTLSPFVLTHTTLPVGPFTGATEVPMPIELSYDLEVAAGKYLHALGGGEVPLLFLFSGSVFLRTPQGTRVQQVPWDLEARHRLPVAVWEELMDLHFPGSGWLRLQRETIDQLQRFKTRNALATWDDVVVALLEGEGVRT